MNLTGKTIDGVIVKPWTWGKVEQIAPYLSIIYTTCKKNSISTITAFFENKDVVSACMPVITKIIAETINCKEEEVKEFTVDKVLLLLLTIIQQNFEYIKNLLSPIQETLESMTEA